VPIQGLKFNINTGTEKHQSYQSTGSFMAYNPNDGYALIALDRAATLLDFDHKLPSQSGGHFPGPVNSYLSIYYMDQSGAGIQGQIIVYGTTDIIQVPRFWSIGRAIQTQVTSMDVIQGTQPPNPPATVDRIWADSNGTLHHLHSDGTDCQLIDSCSQPQTKSGPLTITSYLFTSEVRGGNGEEHLRLGEQSAAAGGSFGINGPGFLFVNVNGGASAIMAMHGGTNTSSVVFDSQNQWSNTPGAADKYVVLYTGGTWWIQNNTGATATFYYETLGF
jgi:hypothetical protein